MDELNNCVVQVETGMKIQKVHKDAQIPTQAEAGAAGYDLYAVDSKVINPGETAIIDTGIRMEIPNDWFGAIYARSGLSIKQGLGLANGVGVIDSSYRGLLMVALHNHSNEQREISVGDRIAQIVFQQYGKVSKFIEVEELSQTDRGEGKFGSTGK